MITFKDFGQKIIELPGWFTDGQIEAVEDTIQRMNFWVEEANPAVINIETIQAILNKNNLGIKSMGKISNAGSSISIYHGTIFRVWFTKE